MKRKKRNIPWPSSRKTESGNTSTPSTPTGLAIPSAKWYQSLQVPLSRFIDCAVDGNYSALIISGYPSQEDLQKAWNDINDQYSDVMGDSEHRMYLKLYREIVALSITIQQIQTLVHILSLVPNKSFEEKLNRLLRSNFRFTDNRAAELEKCLRLGKGFKLKMDMKLSQFNGLRSKHENPGEKPTREYYDNILIALSDHLKYQLTDNIKTYEFCKRVSDFINNKKNPDGRR